MMKKKYMMLLSGSALMFGSLQGAQYPAPNLTQNNNAETPEESPEQQKEELQTLSEAFGHFIGRNINSPGIKFDLELLIKGIREGAEGKPAPMDEKDYEQLLNKHLAKAFLEVSNTNMKAANDFLIENSKKPGVVVLVPGKLQYTILEKGEGEAVKDNGTPLIHYTGTYIDGKVFDDSRKRGTPISLPIANTIPGFRQGLVGMKEGEKRRLFIHPELGYGTSGNLPPNSLLIFDVEVIKADTPKKEALKPGENKSDTTDDESFRDDGDDHYEADLEDDDFQLPQW